MNYFGKVSFNQYKESSRENETLVNISNEYENILLPQRSTRYSAGYDFYAPFDILLSPNMVLKIPTGVNVNLDDDKFLAIYPRSSLGFKYQIGLVNTIAVVDRDYINSDNEGHIFIKIVNRGDKDVHIKKGEAFAQGIIQQYFKVECDNVTSKRNGGLGSTNK